MTIQTVLATPKDTRKLLVSIILAAFVWMCGCTDKAAVERKEFARLEAAVGMVANASPEDRVIRLEQLEAVQVSAERIVQLKNTCVASYRAFEKASGLLEKARVQTSAAEAEVRSADRKKAENGSLSPEEERRILEVGKRAVDSLKSVTGEIDAAERLVAACAEARNHLRFELSAP